MNAVLIPMKIFIFSLLGLFFGLPGLSHLALHGASTVLDTKSVYEQIQKFNEQFMPESFQVELTSLLIKSQLKNIPKEMVDFDKKPRLLLLFKRGRSPRLKVQHVNSFYVNFFSPYEKLISFSGLFLGVDRYNSYEKLHMFFIFKAKQQGDKFIISARERGALSGDYAEYVFSQSLKLISAKFYEAGILGAETHFFFKEENSKRYPYRITADIFEKGNLLDHTSSDEKESNTKLIINFKNYNFTDIEESNFDF